MSPYEARSRAALKMIKMAHGDDVISENAKSDYRTCIELLADNNDAVAMTEWKAILVQRGWVQTAAEYAATKYFITLDAYQAVNLRAALEAICYNQTESPVRALNSGDWCGEIYNILSGLPGISEFRPNKDSDRLIEEARDRARTNGPW